jgi:hypothetical protein
VYAYPKYFLTLLWIALAILIGSGLLLAPGVFELRLEWEVPWTLPAGARSVVAATHGFAATVSLIVVGALLPLHVRAGLRLARNFVSGILLLTALATLAVTGWLIYYVIDEQLSVFASVLHLGAGVICLAPLWIHAVIGIRLRRAREQALADDSVAFVGSGRKRNAA